MNDMTLCRPLEVAHGGIAALQRGSALVGGLHSSSRPGCEVRKRLFKSEYARHVAAIRLKP